MFMSAKLKTLGVGLSFAMVSAGLATAQEHSIIEDSTVIGENYGYTSGTPGQPEAPVGEFDVVLVDGAVEDFPKPLVKRVAEGGRIFTGTVTRGVTRIAAGRVYGGEVSLLPLAEMGVPVMPEFAAHEEWSF